MKLNWTKCSCGDEICDLEYPTNFGKFYQGTGFIAAERIILDEAFLALREKKLRETP